MTMDQQSDVSKFLLLFPFYLLEFLDKKPNEYFSIVFDEISFVKMTMNQRSDVSKFLLLFCFYLLFDASIDISYKLGRIKVMMLQFSASLFLNFFSFSCLNI